MSEEEPVPAAPRLNLSQAVNAAQIRTDEYNRSVLEARGNEPLFPEGLTPNTTRDAIQRLQRFTSFLTAHKNS